jgi:hypothetical protein
MSKQHGFVYGCQLECLVGPRCFPLPLPPIGIVTTEATHRRYFRIPYLLLFCNVQAWLHQGQSQAATGAVLSN